MAKEHVETQLKTIPERPGVYQYFDEEEKLLYVGKAKNLKRRVNSYFNKVQDSGRLKVLVKKIRRIEFIVVETEVDALLLENNLIKEHQPRYNVMLKDDKTYPWICIKKEPFPRVFPTRNVIKDGSEYYGPYASGRIMKNVLELIKGIYPLRTCNYNLTKENIEAGKFKVCLEYHIGNCLGPCEGYQSQEHYDANLQKVREIIKGNVAEVRRSLQADMEEQAASLQFEAAQRTKERIDLLNRYQSKSTVVSPKIHDADVFALISDVQSAYVNYLRVVDGAVIQSHTLEFKKKLDETDEELLTLGMFELRQLYQNHAKESLVSHELDVELDGVKFHKPLRGDKKALVDLSIRNAKQFRQERLKQMQIVDPDRHVNRIMAQMKLDLRLSEEPRHIECFDNSNIQGTNPVAACVVFKNGKPAKKEYRHFNIKTVEGPDDFASMEEVVYRRYKRLVEEEQPLPQLIVIDGGKGQLSAALKSLDKLELRGKIAIIGIAKRLEELFYPNDPVPLYLDKRSETLKIIQQLRNEAHRFGITHHRNRRSKSSFNTELESIPGIGKSTAQDLLKAFKSVKRIKEADQPALEAIVGRSKSMKVWQYFHQGPDNQSQ
ncbi:excinuclease ABC subunit UvrC [Cryomorphaceae bacterium]|nr:excinuclease ABC subunit UvrC [Cryomorphaceae bacterium]